ncbi:hypothetical protein PVAP13_9KG568401, partial [Panicum virgatum]
ETNTAQWLVVRGICRPGRIAALLVLSVSVVTVGERRRRRRRGGGDGASDGLGQGNDGANSTPGCAATFLPLPSS